MTYTNQRNVKEASTMTLQRTRQQGCDGDGWVLFGSRPDNGRWLERWFPTSEAAQAFAGRKGWGVTVR